MSNKGRYDDRHRDVQYQLGDLVMVNDPNRIKGQVAKLKRRWLGPFRVVEVVTPVTYRLEPLIPVSGRGRRRHGVVHVARMKPFADRRPVEGPAEENRRTAPSAPESPPECELRRSGRMRRRPGRFRDYVMERKKVTFHPDLVTHVIDGQPGGCPF